MSYMSHGYRAFAALNYLLLTVIALGSVLPLVHVLAVSFSSSAPASANLVGLWPVGFTWDAYEKTIGNDNFIRSLSISVIRTVAGTAIGMLLVMLTAYPLSKDNSLFKSRSVYIWIFIFTMLFNAGMVPGYVLIQKLGLMNSLWALILPSLVNVYNVVLLLNFFRNVPKELEEASFIDGAGHFQTLMRIYIPVSMPAIATLSLFTMVGHWNAWFDGLLYMTRVEKYPLATFLQTIIVQQDMTRLNVRPEDLENIAQRTIKSAQIFIGAIPILVVYPFLQRFFVKGIVLGAVKE